MQQIPKIQTVVEVTYKVWFSPMSWHFGRRYAFTNDQVIDGKGRVASDLQGHSHRMLDAVRRQRQTIKALSGCPYILFDFCCYSPHS